MVFGNLVRMKTKTQEAVYIYIILYCFSEISFCNKLINIIAIVTRSIVYTERLFGNKPDMHYLKNRICAYSNFQGQCFPLYFVLSFVAPHLKTSLLWALSSFATPHVHSQFIQLHSIHLFHALQYFWGLLPMVEFDPAYKVLYIPANPSMGI